MQNSTQRHLRDIDDVSSDEIREIIKRANDFKNALNAGHDLTARQRGKISLSFFVENSTRTRISFEVAAMRLGMQMIHWDSAKSSLSKGETLDDTLHTLAAMQPDALIMRHSEYNAPRTFSRFMDCPVINAGDSYRAHPTQALLDLMTIEEAKGDVSELTIAICGDIAHSRVARSNIRLLSKLGAQIHIIAPEFLMPRELEDSNIKNFTDMNDGLKGCDVVMMLRLQRERMVEGLIKCEHDYFLSYGLTHERLKHAKPGAVVLHPGPMNRGVEIDDDVADDPHISLIRAQVANGIPARMAVLDLLLEG